MAGDEERTLISPCGLYCGSCTRYRARSDEALRKKMAEREGIAVEEVRLCVGCRQSGGMASRGDVACDTYACAVDAKEVEFCYECEDFPCLKLAPCADRAQGIPHNTKIYSLILLQKLGLDAWLEEYETRLRQYYRGKKPRGGTEIQM